MRRENVNERQKLGRRRRLLEQFKFEVNDKCSFEVNASAIAGVNPIGKNDLIVGCNKGKGAKNKVKAL